MSHPHDDMHTSHADAAAWFKNLANQHGTYDIGISELSTLEHHDIELDMCTSDEPDYREDGEVRISGINIEWKPSSIGQMVTYLRTQIPEQLLIEYFRLEFYREWLATKEQVLQQTAPNCVDDAWEVVREMLWFGKWQTHADHITLTLQVPKVPEWQHHEYTNISNCWWYLACGIKDAHDLKLDFSPAIASTTGRDITIRLFWQSPIYM